MTKKQAKRGIPTGIVGFTVFLLFFLLAQHWLLNFDRSGKFAFYEGPILPMTSVSGAEGITAARHVALDFSTYSESWHPVIDSRNVIVTDTYSLSNPSGEDKTIELAYGFEGHMINEPEFIPSIRVDGRKIEAKLAIAPDVQDKVHNAGTWRGYQKAITEQDHLAEALAETPDLSIPVKVYHYYDITCTGQEREPYVFLNLEFTKSKDTTLWVYDHRSVAYDAMDGSMQMKFEATPEGTGEGYLLIQGEDIAPDLSGYVGYNDSEDAYTDTVTWELETFHSTVEEMIELLSYEYDYWEDSPDYPNPSLTTPEQLYSGAIKRFASGRYTDSAYGCFDIMGSFYEVTTDIGMMYWVFPVEIPAGHTVAVSAQYRQECSEDMGTEKNPRSGYDIASTLGSNLTFTNLTASLSNTDLIEIRGQNMGFDMNQGPDFVTLDLKEARYFVDVMLKWD